MKAYTQIASCPFSSECLCGNLPPSPTYPTTIGLARRSVRFGPVLDGFHGWANGLSVNYVLGVAHPCPFTKKESNPGDVSRQSTAMSWLVKVRIAARDLGTHPHRPTKKPPYASRDVRFVWSGATFPTNQLQDHG
ncbi:hypothetical protein N7540_011872 [Penicillium herquei]|nr:hypothetical protein N7540_011872 [Penicillium herquei]